MCHSYVPDSLMSLGPMTIWGAILCQFVTFVTLGNKCARYNPMILFGILFFRPGGTLRACVWGALQRPSR